MCSSTPRRQGRRERGDLPLFWFQEISSRSTAGRKKAPVPAAGSRRRCCCRGWPMVYPTRSRMKSTITGLVKIAPRSSLLAVAMAVTASSISA